MTTNYTSDDMRAIMMKVANAFIALRDGSNQVADFNILATAMNIGVVRAEAMCQEDVEVFQSAQRALIEADAIYGSLRAYIFTPAALVDMAKGVQAYSELLKMSTPAQMEKAGNEVERRLAVGHLATNGAVH